MEIYTTKEYSGVFNKREKVSIVLIDMGIACNIIAFFKVVKLLTSLDM